IKSIPELDRIKEDSHGLRIGALAKLDHVASSPAIKAGYRALYEAAGSVAFPEIRSMGTIGGNLCQDVRCWYYRYPHHMGGRLLCYRKGSGPCLAVKGDHRYHAIMWGKVCLAVCPSDTATALLALQAEIQVVGARGTRTLPVEDFFTPLGNSLSKGDLVTEIRVPRPAQGNRQTFLKFTVRRPIDFAVASVASVIIVEDGVCVDARIVLGGVAPVPLRAKGAERVVQGKPLAAKTAEEAADASVSEAKPRSGNAYKVEITKTLVKRALLL
ncbi:MAG: FAD binding domain-containing protein, partial [Deltaproteobacteria bacterium]|nr:FAD binding domain-containing protein [Deltaproteobacteria bacterium]